MSRSAAQGKEKNTLQVRGIFFSRGEIEKIVLIGREELEISIRRKSEVENK